MKTIEQARQYYIDSIEDVITKRDIIEQNLNAFDAGVAFAQRWISVDEELPKEDGHYLVVAPKSFPKNCNVVVAEFDKDANNFYSESSDSCIKDATHWRLIEFE